MMEPYYRKGDVALYCGDNADVLPRLAGGFDLVFTSPPYNLGNTSGGGEPSAGGARGTKRMGHYDAAARLGARGGQGKWRAPDLADGYDGYGDAMPHEEYVAWQGRVLSALWLLLSDAGAVFYNHKPRVLDGCLVTPLDYVPVDLRPFVRQEVIWKRAGGINFSGAFYLPTHERIVVVARPAFRLRSKGASGVGDVWDIPQEANTPHPAPFPVDLPARAIETTAPRRVLDPFAGSGTTLVAAYRAGVEAVGIELSERYCEMAARRLDAEPEPLFTPPPPVPEQAALNL